MKLALTPTTLVVWLACLALPAGAEDPSPGEEERPAQAAIRELAMTTTVQVADDSVEAPRVAELQRQAILKYGDETRSIKDSALWVWFDREVPVLFEKIEVNDWSPTSPQWTFCLGSFAESPLTLTMKGSVQAAPMRISAAEFAPVPNAPEPAATEAKWKLQVRGLARQFSIETYAGRRRTELRLLPRPLIEFRPDSEGIQYGAVFGYARGTNTDVLIQLRLQERDAGDPEWSYAIAQMTSEGIVVRHQDEVVAEPPRQRAGEMSNWGYFFTPRDPSIR